MQHFSNTSGSRFSVGALFLWLALATALLGAAGRQAASEARLEELKRTPLDSHELPAAVLEAAKIHYGAMRWAEFFGLAGYARAVFPDAEPARKLRVLEAMALMRHCQFDKASALITGPSGELSGEWGRARRLVVQWLKLTATARIEDKPGNASKQPAPVFDETVHWPVATHAESLKRLSPFAMRGRVEPLCTTEEAP